jgi:hypothetical protein
LSSAIDVNQKISVGAAPDRLEVHLLMLLEGTLSLSFMIETQGEHSVVS